MITVAVHMNNHPAIGVIGDTESDISIIFHHASGVWIPMGLIKVGSPEVRQLPASFAPMDACLQSLDRELGIH